VGPFFLLLLSVVLPLSRLLVVPKQFLNQLMLSKRPNSGEKQDCPVAKTGK
jgi:hypothetical protein